MAICFAMTTRPEYPHLEGAPRLVGIPLLLLMLCCSLAATGQYKVGGVNYTDQQQYQFWNSVEKTTENNHKSNTIIGVSPSGSSYSTGRKMSKSERELQKWRVEEDARDAKAHAEHQVFLDSLYALSARKQAISDAKVKAIEAHNEYLKNNCRLYASQRGEHLFLVNAFGTLSLPIDGATIEEVPIPGWTFKKYGGLMNDNVEYLMPSAWLIRKKGHCAYLFPSNDSEYNLRTPDYSKISYLTSDNRYQYYFAVKNSSGDVALMKANRAREELITPFAYKYISNDAHGNFTAVTGDSMIVIKTDGTRLFTSGIHDSDRILEWTDPERAYLRKNPEVEVWNGKKLKKHNNKYEFIGYMKDTWDSKPQLLAPLPGQNFSIYLTRNEGKFGLIRTDGPYEFHLACEYDSIPTKYADGKLTLDCTPWHHVMVGTGTDMYTKKGVGLVLKKGNKYGFYKLPDESSNYPVMIPCEYDAPFSFSGHGALVKKNGKYGVLQWRGEHLLIECDYDFGFYSKQWNADEPIVARVEGNEVVFQKCWNDEYADTDISRMKIGKFIHTYPESKEYLEGK